MTLTIDEEITIPLPPPPVSAKQVEEWQFNTWAKLNVVAPEVLYPVLTAKGCGCAICVGEKVGITATFFEGREVPSRKPHKVEMLPKRQALWVDALRSPWRFHQLRGTWVSGVRGRCSMAVLFDVAGIRLNGRPGPAEMARGAKWLGVSLDDFSRLASVVVTMNDGLGLSFSAIADRIEQRITV